MILKENCVKRSTCTIALLIFIFLAVPWTCLHAEMMMSIKDMASRTVEVPSKPERIICLGPGTLRLIVYLGVQNRVVGIESMEKQFATGRPYWYANQSMGHLPVVGPGGPAAVNKEPDLEAVLAVNPRLIFITDMEPARAEGLERKLAIPVVLLSYGKMGSFDETVYHSLKIVGEVMGVEKRATEVISYLEQSRKDLLARASRSPKESRPLVYVGSIGFRGTQGIESTDAGYIPFEWTGARNGAEELGGKNHFFADRERLLSLNPEIIFVDAGGVPLLIQDYSKKPDFYRALRAFKSGKAYVLFPYNFYTTNIECALVDAYATGKILYPKAFSDIDLRKKADEIFRFFVGAPVNDRMAKDFGPLGRKLTLPGL
jgi:iron complex transport system substrate-binding protein